MDHSRAPVLEALPAFREEGVTPFSSAVGRRAAREAVRGQAVTQVSGLMLSGVEPVWMWPYA